MFAFTLLLFAVNLLVAMLTIATFHFMLEHNRKSLVAFFNNTFTVSP